MLVVTAVLTMFFILWPDPIVGGADGRGGVAVSAMTGDEQHRPLLPEGYRLLRYDTIGSTNDEAKALARAGAAEGTLVWAGEQTAGRGRRGRAWLSPPGNLYLSLIMRPGGRPGARRAARLCRGARAREALGALMRPGPRDLAANGRTTCSSPAASSPASCSNRK